jgi:hypothetical protein
MIAESTLIPLEELLLGRSVVSQPTLDLILTFPCGVTSTATGTTNQCGTIYAYLERIDFLPIKM